MDADEVNLQHTLEMSAAAAVESDARDEELQLAIAASLAADDAVQAVRTAGSSDGGLSGDSSGRLTMQCGRRAWVCSACTYSHAGDEASYLSCKICTTHRPLQSMHCQAEAMPAAEAADTSSKRPVSAHERVGAAASSSSSTLQNDCVTADGSGSGAGGSAPSAVSVSSPVVAGGASSSRSKRATREPAAVKDLALDDCPVGSFVLAPRSFPERATWCRVLAHREGQLLIDVPYEGSQPLSLRVLQKSRAKHNGALVRTAADMVAEEVELQEKEEAEVEKAMLASICEPELAAPEHDLSSILKTSKESAVSAEDRQLQLALAASIAEGGEEQDELQHALTESESFSTSAASCSQGVQVDRQDAGAALVANATADTPPALEAHAVVTGRSDQDAAGGQSEDKEETAAVLGEAAAAAVDVDNDSDCAWPKQLKLTCEISQQRLKDPAKGEACIHLAKCNYDALKSAVQRFSGNARRVCPVSGCGTQIRMARHIERDSALKRALEALPLSVAYVWVDREGQVTPGAQPTQGCPKRQRVDLENGETVQVDEEAKRRWEERAKSAAEVKLEPKD